MVTYFYMQSSVVSLCVCLSVRLFVTFMSPTNAAEPIEMPFAWLSRVGPRNQELDEVQMPKGKEQFFDS